MECKSRGRVISRRKGKYHRPTKGFTAGYVVGFVTKRKRAIEGNRNTRWNEARLAVITLVWFTHSLVYKWNMVKGSKQQRLYLCPYQHLSV